MVVCYTRSGTMMRIRVALTLALALAPLGAGCSKKNDAPTTAETASAASAVSVPPLAPGAPVGVAECDENLRKWEACLGTAKSPLAGSQPAIKAQRDSFRIAARTPEGKEGLRPLCQSMLARLAADKSCALPPGK